MFDVLNARNGTTGWKRNSKPVSSESVNDVRTSLMKLNAINDAVGSVACRLNSLASPAGAWSCACAACGAATSSTTTAQARFQTIRPRETNMAGNSPTAAP